MRIEPVELSDRELRWRVDRPAPGRSGFVAPPSRMAEDVDDEEVFDDDEYEEFDELDEDFEEDYDDEYEDDDLDADLEDEEL